MDWQILLITVYIQISVRFGKSLWIHCQRFTNNNSPGFADEEVITIFLYGVMQRRSNLKDIYNYARNHLSDWFPCLPSYVAFVNRLNRLSDIFPILTEQIISDFSGTDMVRSVRLIDSFPVILANAKRSSRGKVAGEFANKGHCVSKGIWYYGIKVHILGISRPGTLPLPEHIGITPAGEHDLSAFRRISPYIANCDIYADKAYADETERQFLREQGTEILTPVRKKKGQQIPGLSDRLHSASVSRVRQPIESLFNWIHEKTNIEIASKVRSYKGLLVHVFGRLSAAMFMMVFNS